MIFFKKYIILYCIYTKKYLNGIFVLLGNFFFEIYFCLKVQEILVVYLGSEQKFLSNTIPFLPCPIPKLVLVSNLLWQLVSTPEITHDRGTLARATNAIERTPNRRWPMKHLSLPNGPQGSEGAHLLMTFCDTTSGIGCLTRQDAANARRCMGWQMCVLNSHVDEHI